MMYDIAIVGSGAAGMTAAIHALFEGLSVALVEDGQVGGQAATTSMIHNYPGFPHEIDGNKLMRLFSQQIKGVHFYQSKAKSLLSFKDGWSINETIVARRIILATGLSFRHMSQFDEWEGKGLFYGPRPDVSAHLWLHDVVVVGGANSAGQAVLNLAKYCRHVHLVSHHEQLESTMSKGLIDEIKEHSNIVLHFQSELMAVYGNSHVEGVKLSDRECDCKAVFVCIGQHPTNDWLNASLLDDKGYIKTDERLETSLRGVYAIGDCRSGSEHRISSAVGDGSNVIAYILEVK